MYIIYFKNITINQIIFTVNNESPTQNLRANHNQLLAILYLYLYALLLLYHDYFQTKISLEHPAFFLFILAISEPAVRQLDVQQTIDSFSIKMPCPPKEEEQVDVALKILELQQPHLHVVPAPQEIREITQTDRLNKKLISSFLERMNVIDIPNHQNESGEDDNTDEFED